MPLPGILKIFYFSSIIVIFYSVTCPDQTIIWDIGRIITTPEGQGPNFVLSVFIYRDLKQRQSVELYSIHHLVIPMTSVRILYVTPLLGLRSG